MKPHHLALLSAFAVTFTAGGPVLGQDAGSDVPMPRGGPLRTMPHGSYQCALPGDAGSDAYEVVEAENFRIFTASRYENQSGSGTYILRGDSLTFTAGPKKGERFERLSRYQLRKLNEDGQRSELLCTRLIGRR